MEKELLTIEHLKKSFGDSVILDDVNLTVKQGEVIVIIGPSGCGKSTLLRCINALEPEWFSKAMSCSRICPS